MSADDLVPLYTLDVGARFKEPGSDTVYTLRGIKGGRRGDPMMLVVTEEGRRMLVLKTLQVLQVNTR